LSSLLKRRDLPTETVIAVIQSAERISSDEVKASILKQVIDSYSRDPAVRSHLRGALESLQSNDQYRELMSALSKQEAAH
jgi:arginine deiminase